MISCRTSPAGVRLPGRLGDGAALDSNSTAAEAAEGWWEVNKSAANELRAVVEEALEPGVFGEWWNCEDPALKHTDLHDICKRHGYGAVMHYVEWLWKTHGQYPGSEHTVAACAKVRRDWIERAKKALGAVS